MTDDDYAALEWLVRQRLDEVSQGGCRRRIVDGSTPARYFRSGLLPPAYLKAESDDQEWLTALGALEELHRKLHERRSS